MKRFIQYFGLLALQLIGGLMLLYSVYVAAMLQFDGFDVSRWWVWLGRLWLTIVALLFLAVINEFVDALGDGRFGPEEMLHYKAQREADLQKQKAELSKSDS